MIGRWLDKIPLAPLSVMAIMLGLAPFMPEPHLLEKARMLINGELSRPIDIFDLLMHGALPLVLVFKLWREFQLKRAQPMSWVALGVLTLGLQWVPASSEAAPSPSEPEVTREMMENGRYVVVLARSAEAEAAQKQAANLKSQIPQIETVKTETEYLVIKQERYSRSEALLEAVKLKKNYPVEPQVVRLLEIKGKEKVKKK